MNIRFKTDNRVYLLLVLIVMGIVLIAWNVDSVQYDAELDRDMAKDISVLRMEN
jgi:hypothetical protein